MDLLTLLLGLPFAPVRGAVAIAEVLRDQAERELYHPNVARRQLEDLAQARTSGEISTDEETEKQQQILDRMMGPPPGDTTPDAGPGEQPGVGPGTSNEGGNRG